MSGDVHVVTWHADTIAEQIPFTSVRASMSRKPTTGSHVENLRSWARGSYPLEAAVELLIHSGFAEEHHTWIWMADGTSPAKRGTHWVNFEHLRFYVQQGPLSGGERRLLSIACSLAGETIEDFGLDEALPGLDRDAIKLVLAAVSHASGSHEHFGHTAAGGAPLGALYPWPETQTAT